MYATAPMNTATKRAAQFGKRPSLMLRRCGMGGGSLLTGITVTIATTARNVAQKRCIGSTNGLEMEFTLFAQTAARRWTGRMVRALIDLTVASDYDETGCAYRKTSAAARAEAFAALHDAARWETKTCDGCYWRNRRYQKCSCCRRNRNMKDNYKEEK